MDQHPIDKTIFVSSNPKRSEEIQADIKSMNTQIQSLEDEKASLKGRLNQDTRRRISRKILRLRDLVEKAQEKFPPSLFNERAAAQDVIQNAKLLRNFNDTKAKIMKRLEASLHPSDVVAWTLVDLVKAEVRRDGVVMIITRLDHICENVGVSSEDGYTLAMVREVIDDVREDLERYLLHGNVPASTSHIHNAVGLAKIGAKACFLQDLKWFVESNLKFYEEQREKLEPVPIKIGS